MFDAPVTWGELIKIVLILIGTGVLFYLLLAVANLVGILKNINKMLNKNLPHINSSLEKLPAITDNVAKVSDIVRDEMESIQKVVGNIGKISDTARDAAEMIKKDIVVKAKNLLDIFDWIRNLFQDKSSKKKAIVYKYRYKPAADTVEETIIQKEADESGKEPSQEVKEGEVEQGEGI